eukprot:Mycagemm_TRINITY_DN10241_c0_g2::TRINITY_DN10241_c0_g2_i1::g.4044::m.4044 type:complete len:109 gc:universal TRINITY_DN10241_c0_g2_i1:354-28(-)
MSHDQLRLSRCSTQSCRARTCSSLSRVAVIRMATSLTFRSSPHFANARAIFVWLLTTPGLLVSCSTPSSMMLMWSCSPSPSTTEVVWQSAAQSLVPQSSLSKLAKRAA